MPAIKGSLIKLKKGDGASPEVFTAIAGSRNVSLNLGGDRIEITTADDINASGVSWRTYIAGIVDFSASFNGVIKNVASFNALIASRLADTVENYQLEITGYGTFEGPMTITSFEVNGEFSDAGTFTVGVSASGPISYTPAA